MTIEVSRLANGITVVSHRMPQLESVALGVWVGAGARSEAVHEHGVSHLLEHMAFKGTRRRSAREIAETIEAVGGEMNAETSVDHTAYYVRVLKEDALLGLDVLADILTGSVFDAEELTREQHVIAQEIGAALDTPEDIVFDYFQEAAYPGQAIGRSILGTPASVKALGPADLTRFLATHYRGPGMVVSAAGAVDHDALVKAAERNLAAIPAASGPTEEPGTYRGGQWLKRRKLQEAQILLGFEAPSFRHPRYHAAMLLSSVLGGGMASRLFQEAREKRGLCYSIYSFHWPFTDTGILGIQAATSEADIAALVPVILRETARIGDSVTPAELDRAKAQMRAGLLMALESPLARAGQMARHVLIYGRPLELAEIVAAIDKVTPADIGEAAEAMLRSPPTLAGIGPIRPLPGAAAIADQLARMGA